MDPFVVLGIPPAMDLDEGELERRYIELSRACHPDHQGAASPAQQVEALQRSAKLNDAYRKVIDPWQRAAALLNLRDPSVLERTKQLCPIFLAEAMELTEEVTEADDDQAAQLAARVERLVAEDLRSVTDKIEGEDWEGAATQLHQSRYHRKALEDLKAKT